MIRNRVSQMSPISYQSLNGANLGSRGPKEEVKKRKIGKITVYGIPEIMFWNFRNWFLIFQEWYNEKSEIFQPPRSASFEMLIVMYQNETIQFREYRDTKARVYRKMGEIKK